MAVLLDTSLLPLSERPAAVAVALRAATAPCEVRFDDEHEPDRIYSRIDAWQLGPAGLWRSEGSGQRMRRTGTHVREDIDGPLSIAVQERGTAHIDYSHYAAAQHAAPGDLICVDLTKPYEYSWAGAGSAFCLSVPHESLGLPDDRIRDACRQIHTSPLYEVFRCHLQSVAHDIDRLAEDPAAAEIGRASTELFRALLTTATHDRNAIAQMPDSTLATQAQTYIQQHLRDPGLTATVIAAALHVSTRQLFKVCAAAGFSIEQWTIDRRLDAARVDLARRTSAHLTIAAIARRNGFADPGHFSRRFRTTFGITAKEWRALHGGARGDGVAHSARSSLADRRSAAAVWSNDCARSARGAACGAS